MAKSVVTSGCIHQLNSVQALVGKQCLVPPGPTFGSWAGESAAAPASGRGGEGSNRYDTHMGLAVTRASRDEEREETWESVAIETTGALR